MAHICTDALERAGWKAVIPRPLRPVTTPPPSRVTMPSPFVPPGIGPLQSASCTQALLQCAASIKEIIYLGTSGFSAVGACPSPPLASPPLPSPGP